MKRNIDIEKLRVNEGQIEGLPENPRFIKDEKYKKLIQSIKDDPEMLNLRELLVYKLNGEYVVVAGNMRLRALKEMGYTNAPCKIINAETPPEKLRAIAIKDNLGYGEDDWTSLMENWDREELEDWGVDVEKNWPIAGPIAEEDDYEIPDEIETDIQLGDIFQIGEHRLMCGDSTDSDQVAKLMDGMKADCVVTDPPYNTGMTPNKKNEKARLSHMFQDSFTADEWDDFLNGAFSVYNIFTKGECALYVFIDWRRVGDIKSHLETIAAVKNVIVWDKGVHGLGSDYKSTYEMCVVGKKGNPNIQNRYGTDYQDIWRVQRNMGRNKDHATVKPVELISKPILHASKQDDIVLDLFLGSGTTMVAAHQLNRKCYGMEIDPHYCQVIIDRMKALDPEIEIKKLNS